MTPDDRRPFRNVPFERGRNDRPAGPPPERGDRPGFAGPRPFVRPPTRGGDMPPPDHRVHLRDGDREIEVSGNPAFVRQVLDDLPVLMARLRGDAPGRTAISMPAPPQEHPTDAAVTTTSATHPASALAATDPTPADPAPAPAGTSAANGDAPAAAAPASLEVRILDVLRRSPRPLSIAAIRQRLDADGISGQQVRRLLEKTGAGITVSAERPATYSLG